MAVAIQDGEGAFGVPGMMPEVLNPPEGWTLVRLRFRPDEFITGYFRKGESFGRWWMKWADAKHLYLEPLCPVGLNLRRRPGKVGPRTPLAGHVGLEANGSIAVCDPAGRQIPELQEGWPVAWALQAAAHGYDPEGFIFETRTGKIRIVRNEDGSFNWEAS